MPNQPIDYSDTVICKIVCNDKNRQQYKDTDNLRDDVWISPIRFFWAKNLNIFSIVSTKFV